MQMTRILRDEDLSLKIIHSQIIKIFFTQARL